MSERLHKLDEKVHEIAEGHADANGEPRNQLEYIEHSRKQHGYSKGINKLFDMALSYMADAENGNKSGKQPAVWSTGLMEAPLLYACDTIPMAVYDLGRLGSSDRAVEMSEEVFDMPGETCSMVTALLGEWYLRRDNSVKKVVALSTVCEPLNMAYEMIREFGFDIHRVEQVIKPVHGGEERLEQMVKFLSSELEDVAVFLTGKPLDQDKMRVEIARMNRLMGKFREILKLRIANPLYIKSLPTLFLLMGSGHYYGKPEEYEVLLDELIEEIKAAEYVASPMGKIIPVTWVGARGLEFGVYKAVDDLGGALLSWFTPNPYDRVWREDIPPLEAMARFILEYFVTGSPVNQIKYIEKMIEESGSKGMLFYTYIGCPYGGMHVELFRNHFQKKGVPSSGLEGSWQVGAPSGQLITRVRAFIEMLS